MWLSLTKAICRGQILRGSRAFIGLLILQASFVWIPGVVRTLPHAEISLLRRLVPTHLRFVPFSSLLQRLSHPSCCV